MAYSMESGERTRVWRIFKIAEPSNNATGINWSIFWACFEVSCGRFYFSIRTPWFMVQLSSGQQEWTHYARWYGLRVNWGHVRGWRVNDGGLLFTKGDPFLSFMKTVWMRETNGR